MNKVQILMRLVRSLDIWHWPLLLATTWVSFRYIPSSHVTYQSTHVLPSTTSTALNYCRTFNVIKRPSNTVHLTIKPTHLHKLTTKRQKRLSHYSVLSHSQSKKMVLAASSLPGVQVEHVAFPSTAKPPGSTNTLFLGGAGS